MVTQKLISFKVDTDLLNRIDSIVSRCDGRLSWRSQPVRLNRNKLLNYALSFMVESIELQLDVLDSRHIDDKMPNFISEI